MQLKHISLALATFLAVGVSHAEQVGHITWNTSDATPTTQQLSDSTAGVVFIRPNQARGVDSSINIAINDRYLTSLADGHYSSDVVCAGDVQISAVPTKALTNDLSANAIHIRLNPRQTQYFLVEVDSQYRPILRQINDEQARQLFVGKYRQAHQVSRTRADDCSVPTFAPAPVITPAVVPAPVQPVVKQAPSIRLNINFDTNKSDIKPAYQGEVDRAAQFLQDYQDKDVLVEGHTDSVGNDSYNQKLSERRAEAVRQALINNHNINPQRIRAVGYGESNPIASNDTETGRAENRRVVVTVLNQQ